MTAKWLLEILTCPSCRRALSFEPDGLDGDGFLVHDSAACTEVYPVIAGVPRVLRSTFRAEVAAKHVSWFHQSPRRLQMWDQWRNRTVGADVVKDFDFEWSLFTHVDTADHKRVFRQYFDLVTDSAFSADAMVLDAGCGAGRWAAAVASRGPRVIAVDLGSSIDVARRNTDPERIACVQADIHDLPFRDSSFDWGYSLGVLHHVEDPTRPLAEIARCVRARGKVLIYVYYALDNRGAAFRALFLSVNAVRILTSRLPRPAVLAFSATIAALVYWPLARLARTLEYLGLQRIASSIPLAAYRHLSFETMRNDSLDRFGTRLERRFTREEARDLLLDAGLEAVEVADSLPYWHLIGSRPATTGQRS